MTFRYKVLKGKHEHGKTKTEVKRADGTTQVIEKPIRYEEGDEFDSPVDLHKLIDPTGEKFMRIRTPEEQAAIQSNPFEAMTVAQLRDLAVEHEINIEGLRKKHEIVKVITESMEDVEEDGE
jgi:hypothetical protein